MMMVQPGHQLGKERCLGCERPSSRRPTVYLSGYTSEIVVMRVQLEVPLTY